MVGIVEGPEIAVNLIESKEDKDDNIEHRILQGSIVMGLCDIVTLDSTWYLF